MERQATRSGRAWKGAVKGTECLCLVSAWVLVGHASEKSVPQRVGHLGRHSSAINGFVAAPACQCSSRHNTRWPRPGGTKNGGRTRACAGILLPYSRKGSWASWKRACSRNLTFTLGLEGSGRLNPRSSPGSAAQGCYMFMLPRGGEAIPVFITALGPVPPVGPEMLSAGEIKWFFPMK